MSADLRTSILLGEDEEDDVILFRFVLKKVKPNPEVVVLRTGEDILEYLKQLKNSPHPESRFAPSAIFLDGQLHHQPSMGLLRWIVQNPSTKDIPVFILTGSLDPKVGAEAKAIGAVECFEKPFTADDWMKVQAVMGMKR
jgi:CheY-like chemotaxis protein